MMLEITVVLTLAAAATAGALLGACYFGGLWWTVQRMPQTEHPLKWYFSSLAVRLSVVLLGLWGLLVACPWPALPASLVGFLGMRVLLTRWLGPRSLDGAPARSMARSPKRSPAAARKDVE